MFGDTFSMCFFFGRCSRQRRPRKTLRRPPARRKSSRATRRLLRYGSAACSIFAQYLCLGIVPCKLVATWVLIEMRDVIRRTHPPRRPKTKGAKSRLGESSSLRRERVNGSGVLVVCIDAFCRGDNLLSPMLRGLAVNTIYLDGIWDCTHDD